MVAAVVGGLWPVMRSAMSANGGNRLQDFSTIVLCVRVTCARCFVRTHFACSRVRAETRMRETRKLGTRCGTGTPLPSCWSVWVIVAHRETANALLLLLTLPKMRPYNEQRQRSNTPDLTYLILLTTWGVLSDKVA